MLSLTRKADYGLVAVAGLAAAEPRGLSARDLAAELKLPLAALRNILKDLARHGLLESTRGQSGGYRLARAASEITIGQVVEAIEGPVQLARCCPTSGAEDEGCPLEHSCRIKGMVRDLHGRIRAFLDQVTVAELASGAGAAQVSVESVAAGAMARV